MIKAWTVAHTGDWRASCLHRDVAHESFVEIVEGDETVALAVAWSPTHFGLDQSALEARARLITAAPDLLSLLQDAVTMFAPHMEGGEEDEWVKFSRAAIAKALGPVDLSLDTEGGTHD